MVELSIGDKAPSFSLKDQDGRTYQGIIRSSFLLDEKSRILQASYKVKPQDTVAEVRKALA